MKWEIILEMPRGSSYEAKSSFVRVDLSNMVVQWSGVPDAYRDKGGRQLTSSIISKEVPATSEPLSPENKIVVAPGLLSYPYIPCSGRTSIGSKSPLTRGIKESNVGGTLSHSLVRLGVRALIIEGARPVDGPFAIKIDKDRISIMRVSGMANMSNYLVAETARSKFGPRVSVASIGPAGERLLPMSTVAVTDSDGFPSRHAGRGGLGAVLGSKGVKVIVVDPSGSDGWHLPPNNPMRRIARNWAVSLSEGKQVLRKYGTANLVTVVNSLGGLPTRNFSSGQFEDADMISGESLRQTILKRGGRLGHSCHPGCAIRCSNVFVDGNGTHITSGLEYETIALVGANCGISDLDTIARADRRCDELGIDTMELGNTIAVAMEAGLADFGDASALLDLIEGIAQGTAIGQVLGQGTSATGKTFAVKRIPVVKNQGMAAYDPRVFKGTGVTYATSPMGADHTAGNCLPGRGGLLPENQSGLDPHNSDGQCQLSHDVQILTTICDILGLCFFVGTTPSNLEIMTSLLEALTMRQWTIDSLITAARMTLKEERLFNLAAGIDSSQDRLPDYFMYEALPPTGLIYDVPQDDIMKVAEAWGK